MSEVEETANNSLNADKSSLPIFSEINEIQSFLAENMIKVNRAGIMISVKKEIPYGTQLNLEGQGETGLINIYYSKKKGLSFVDCSKNDTSANAIDVLQGGKGISELDKWIGTDESGKGDFFGPLVIAGFFITRDIENDVQSLGVTDSKNLTSERIGAIAGKLWKKYKDNISVVAPSNLRYNQLYEEFKNLNKLLAWGHARVIDNLVEKWQRKNVTIENVVSDQFGNEKLIENALLLCCQ
jgi:ribonuclease HIII